MFTAGMDVVLGVQAECGVHRVCRQPERKGRSFINSCGCVPLQTFATGRGMIVTCQVSVETSSTLHGSTASRSTKLFILLEKPVPDHSMKQ